MNGHSDWLLITTASGCARNYLSPSQLHPARASLPSPGLVALTVVGKLSSFHVIRLYYRSRLTCLQDLEVAAAIRKSDGLTRSVTAVSPNTWQQSAENTEVKQPGTPGTSALHSSKFDGVTHQPIGNLPHHAIANKIQGPNQSRGGIVVRLVASTWENEVLLPARPPPDFHTWESCRTIPLVGGEMSADDIMPSEDILLLRQLLRLFLVKYTTALDVVVLDSVTPQSIQESEVKTVTYSANANRMSSQACVMSEPCAPILDLQLCLPTNSSPYPVRCKNRHTISRLSNLGRHSFASVIASFVRWSLYRLTLTTDYKCRWGVPHRLSVSQWQKSIEHIKNGVDPSVQGQEARAQYGRQLHARLAPHRSSAHGVQCFRRDAVLCKLDLAGETGDPRKNPLTSGIVRLDPHPRKSGETRPGIGSEQSIRSATVAPCEIEVPLSHLAVFYALQLKKNLPLCLACFFRAVDCSPFVITYLCLCSTATEYISVKRRNCVALGTDLASDWLLNATKGKLVLAQCCTHTRCTQQEPVTRVEPRETECIAVTHERAARQPLHTRCDVNCNTAQNTACLATVHHSPLVLCPYRIAGNIGNLAWLVWWKLGTQRQLFRFCIVVYTPFTVTCNFPVALLKFYFQNMPPPLAEWLACSPPAKAIRVQSPGWSLRIFACGNRAGRCCWSAGFLGNLPFPPPFSFRRCSILTSITLIGSQDLDVKSPCDVTLRSGTGTVGRASPRRPPRFRESPAAPLQDVIGDGKGGGYWPVTPRPPPGSGPRLMKQAHCPTSTHRASLYMQTSPPAPPPLNPLSSFARANCPCQDDAVTTCY
ncbi:hypothetical protein PR048_015523 [Dryococelus australis]|uniref:Uncharacterized protein n=1 Tax=Dryococelus australis TaxID=614101 RepID=A0ABQ9HH92_9NEOP|nr:hypothetical protein PR048_015523 [Dryococelus australis]